MKVARVPELLRHPAKRAGGFLAEALEGGGRRGARHGGRVALDRHGNLAAAPRPAASPASGSAVSATRRCRRRHLRQQQAPAPSRRPASARSSSSTPWRTTSRRLMEYKGMSAKAAADEVMFKVLKPDIGGCIVVSHTGEVAAPFDADGMFRGVADFGRAVDGRHLAGQEVTTYALSLKQPWATMLVHGIKCVEVRMADAATGPNPRPRRPCTGPAAGRLEAYSAAPAGLHAARRRHRRGGDATSAARRIGRPTSSRPSRSCTRTSWAGSGRRCTGSGSSRSVRPPAAGVDAVLPAAPFCRPGPGIAASPPPGRCSGGPARIHQRVPQRCPTVRASTAHDG